MINQFGVKVKPPKKQPNPLDCAQPRKKVIPHTKIGTCPHCNQGPCTIRYNKDGETVSNDCDCQRRSDPPVGQKT